jgi:predicted Zn-dependent protease
LTDFERKISAAQGYTELGMLDDALAELDAIDPSLQRSTAVIEMRLLIFMRAKRWAEALPLSYELCRLHPEATAGFVHSAFCLHELGRTPEAKEMLLSGPPAMQREPTYFYNLACYDVALGNIDQALRNVERSFQMDKRYREFAKADPDLEPIRHLL